MRHADPPLPTARTPQDMKSVMESIESKAPKALTLSPAFLRFLHDLPAPPASDKAKTFNRMTLRAKLLLGLGLV